ncbi:phospholipase D-like domain-containing protein [Mangrovibacterium diazotrophicum]|uniref:Uncharacterized protein n=1 Tax=Mangrovibacterium diazotrophicum TaxID=1261403 RepID=A0A419W3X7_9BACT|nr:hypothetical protein [Mangrovibacterium diazotrophicum]RKD90050.1 hypothetical protein BC643_0386 [Mangrovibacterium diazotrophicum]
MIDRQNILDLIGRYANRYTSCVITCFSFDFTFFEERVMTILRTANIKNVNVFIDGKFLEQTQEMTAGYEFSNHRTYSINPIYETGVFHPKIMMLTGPKHGLLVIGSGNLTTSGLSTNDEIWGAFHLDSPLGPNASIFANVWYYLQSYLAQAKGFNQQKIDWIKKWSPWLEEIKSPVTNDFVPIDNNQSVKFVANQGSANSYTELQQSLPSQTIERLTVVSPYFDEKGQLLEQLDSRFEIKTFNCLTDPSAGILPYRMSEKLRERLVFYDWTKLIKDFDDTVNRLHAKIIHFQYADGLEYMYLGSANATLAGFGYQSNKAANAEAGVLIKRENGKSYLSELGIQLTNNAKIVIPTTKGVHRGEGDALEALSFDNRIVYAEINGSKIHLYLKQVSKQQFNLCVEDNLFEVKESFTLDAGSLEYKIELKTDCKARRVYLTLDDKRVSNYALLHNVVLQAKCNPDPSQAKLNEIVAGILNDSDEALLADLLSHADYQWIDGDGYEGTSISRGSSNAKIVVEREKVYAPITEDEFNQLESLQARHAEILNSPSVQIAEVLNLVSRGLINKEVKVHDSAEEMLANIDIDEQDGVEIELDRRIDDRAQHEKECRAIYRHLDKIDKLFENGLKRFYKTGIYKDTPEDPVNHKVLSNVSTFIDLLYLCYNKYYETTNTIFKIRFKREFAEQIKAIESQYGLVSTEQLDRDDINVKFYKVDSDLFPKVLKALNDVDADLFIHDEEYATSSDKVFYIEEGVLSGDDSWGLKYYIVDTLAHFILHSNSRAGFKKYSYDLANERMNRFRKDICEKAIFLLGNVSWRQKDEHLLQILVLDLLHFVYPEAITADNMIDLFQDIHSFYDNPRYMGKKLKSQLTRMLNEYVPAYMQWRAKYDSNRDQLFTDKNDVGLGDFIFSSNIGFTRLRNRYPSKLMLEKPGFEWDQQMNTYCMPIEYATTKIVAFTERQTR